MTVTSTSDQSTSAASANLSRREKREAERAAEREAFLTGQQPLLTRREMRRLREEAAALREAVERGELTEEQASALQNPLADQSGIEAAVESGGHHAAQAVPAERSWAGEPGQTHAGEEPTAPPGFDEAVVKGAVPVGAVLEPADDVTQMKPAAPEGQEEASVTAEGGARASAARVAVAADEGPEGPEGPAVGPEGPVEGPVASVEAEAPVEPTAQPGDSATFLPTWSPVFGETVAVVVDPEQAAQAQPDEGPEVVNELTPDQVARSMEETAEAAIPAVEDLPAVVASASQDEADEPAVVPARRSLRGRLQAEQAPEPVAAPVVEDTPAVAPVRRPIVRIPAAAQGVRTVDSTGELSEVQPVDDDFDGIENPHWPALRPESVEEAAAAVPVASTPDAPASIQVDEGAVVEDAPVVDSGSSLAEEPGDAVEVEPYEAGRSGGLLRMLLMLLLVVVLGLVIGALVWFLVLNRSDSTALGPVAVAVADLRALLT